MTEDYKSKLIKYLTGNIETETGDDTIPFEPSSQNVNNLNTYLSNNFNQYFIVDLIQSYTNDTYVLVGGYWVSGQKKGFIILLDKNFNIIETFTQYSSGVDIGGIYCINVREDGKFYMIETRLSDNKDRFLLVNNFTTPQADSTYKVIIKDSYDIPNINYLIVTYDKVLKSPGEAKYLIVMTIINNDVQVPFCFELVINVGSANEWNQYLYDNSVVGTGIDITDAWASWTSDSLTFKIVGQVNDGYAEIYNNSTSTMTYKNIIQTLPIADFNNYRRSSIVMNDTTAYYSVWGYSTSDTSKCYIYLFKINYTTNALDLILTINSAIPDSMGLVGSLSLDFYKWENNCFFLASENVDSANSTEDLSFIRIAGDKTYSNTVVTNTNIGDLHLLAINNKYNLFSVIIQDGSTANVFSEIYNSSNYNGIPYEAPNCLNPNSAILYDNNDKIIFARNLYNKTILGATTTSTVQIPNTLLNDVTIGLNTLISATNVPIVEDSTDITKNIYETVNVNFVNSISMRNDNDPNNTILNPTGAIRLNVSTSQLVDYENAQATKVRINYTDETNSIITLNSSVQIKMMSNTVAKYKFSIFVSKEIENMQIISHDEMTVYQTITGLNLTIGKIYNIVQYVSINRPIIFNDVLYNGENILYNGEQVTYVN